MRIFGENLINREGKTIEIRRLLTNHLIEDLGRVVSVEDWARDLLPDTNDSFYKFLAKKRAQIEADQVPGETELLAAYHLSEKDRAAVKEFLAFPLATSDHPGALLVTHNSFAVYLAERILGVAFVRAGRNSNVEKPKNGRLVPVREVFERVIFHRLKVIYSPAEIVARTAAREWMRGSLSPGRE